MDIIKVLALETKPVKGGKAQAITTPVPPLPNRGPGPSTELHYMPDASAYPIERSPHTVVSAAKQELLCWTSKVIGF